MKKQTAVDWLKAELDKFVRSEFGDDPYTRYTLKDLYNSFEQAKALEKEQIIEAYKADCETLGFNETFGYDAEKYYKETYEQEN